MYSKMVTQKIIEYQAMGFSAEETKQALQEHDHTEHICINTIYKHRHSPTGQAIIDELLRQQERAILKTSGERPDLAMKYRNELLKILVPQRIEAISLTKEVIENRDITIIADYSRAVEAAVNRDIEALRTRKQMDTTQPQNTTT